MSRRRRSSSSGGLNCLVFFGEEPATRVHDVGQWRRTTLRKFSLPAAITLCCLLFVFVRWRSSSSYDQSQLQNDALAIVHMGHLPGWMIFSLLFARYSHPLHSIHLVRMPTDDDTPDDKSVRWSSLFKAANITVSHVDPDQPAFDEWDAKYRHSSLNPIAYESFCFLRWQILLSHMIGNDLQRVLVIDADIVLMENVFEKARRSRDVSSGPYGVYLQIFSRERLAAWVRAINAFYDRPLDVVCTDIDRLGYSGENPRWTEDVVALVQAECPWRPKANQFSDMYLFAKSFDQAYASSPVHAYPQRLSGLAWDSAMQPRAANETACDTAEGFLSAFKWKQRGRFGPNHSRLALGTTGELLPFVHLQGPCKPLFCPVFCAQVRPEHRQLIDCCNQPVEASL